MYKGSCSCQAIQLELTGICENDFDVETLSYSDNTMLTVSAHRDALVIDCAPSVLGEVVISPTQKQTFCNLCATPVFTEDNCGNIALHVHFYGHDLLAEHHGQYHIP